MTRILVDKNVTVSIRDGVQLATDVFPDGQALILTEGNLRAQYRNSFTELELL